jgi:hypothetical protein
MRFAWRSGPMNLRAARLELGHQILQVTVQVVDRLVLDLRRGLARGFPVLEPPLHFIALDLVLAQGGLDEAAMTEVGGQDLGRGLELGGGGGHGVAGSDQ